MTWPYGQVMPIPTRQIVGIANCWRHLRPLAVREPRHRARSRAVLAWRRAGDGIFFGRYRSPVDRYGRGRMRDRRLAFLGLRFRSTHPWHWSSEEFVVRPGADERHGTAGSDIVVDAVDEEKIPSDVAFPMIGPLSLERVVFPLRGQRRVVVGDEPHDALEPWHVVTSGPGQALPVLDEGPGESDLAGEAGPLASAWLCQVPRRPRPVWRRRVFPASGACRPRPSQPAFRRSEP